MQLFFSFLPFGLPPPPHVALHSWMRSATDNEDTLGHINPNAPELIAVFWRNYLLFVLHHWYELSVDVQLSNLHLQSSTVRQVGQYRLLFTSWRKTDKNDFLSVKRLNTRRCVIARMYVCMCVSVYLCVLCILTTYLFLDQSSIYKN